MQLSSIKPSTMCTITIMDGVEAHVERISSARTALVDVHEYMVSTWPL